MVFAICSKHAKFGHRLSQPYFKLRAAGRVVGGREQLRDSFQVAPRCPRRKIFITSLLVPYPSQYSRKNTRNIPQICYMYICIWRIDNPGLVAVEMPEIFKWPKFASRCCDFGSRHCQRVNGGATAVRGCLLSMVVGIVQQVWGFLSPFG